MWTRRIQALLTGCVIGMASLSTMGALAANEGERPFPPQAKRGTMAPANFPAIIIDDKARNLSAGAQIRNANNLIETPGALRGNSYVVNYTENLQGDIDRIWILTSEEAKRSSPTPTAAITIEQLPKKP